MNEFREYLGLKKFTSFEDWAGDQAGVAEAARQLYGNIDDLELVRSSCPTLLPDAY
jgi:hypothetical protein